MFSGASYVIQVTDAAPITYSIDFLDLEGNSIADMPADVRNSSPHVFTYLTDGDGNVVGWRCVPFDQNSCTASINDAMFSSNCWDQSNPNVSYDPAVHTLNARVVRGNHSVADFYNVTWSQEQQNNVPVGEANWNGYDQFDGYDFIKTGDPTRFTMQKAWNKKLTVDLSYAGGDTGESAPGTIIIRAKAATTGWHYYRLPVNNISWNNGSGTYEINEWFKRSYALEYHIQAPPLATTTRRPGRMSRRCSLPVT